LVVSKCTSLLKDVLDVHPSGDELRARLCHRPQESFPALINRGDITKVHYAWSFFVVGVRLFPACPQFIDPRPDQPALQNPSLFRGGLIDGDFQHGLPVLPV
jgi:hypothetical protein